jgi:hypothetical protein
MEWKKERDRRGGGKKEGEKKKGREKHAGGSQAWRSRVLIL